jgi:hypothetical protein
MPSVLEPRPIELQARLVLFGDRLSGELLCADGRRIEFEGWLGLLGAIESAGASERDQDKAEMERRA